MRLISPNTLWTLTLSLTLAVGCSGGAPADDSTDASGGMGGQASGGQGSGGDGSGGESSATGGSGTGGDDGSGGDASGGSDGSGGDESSGGTGSGGDESSGGQGGAGSGGDGSGGDGSGGDQGSGGNGSGGGSGECTNGDTRPGSTPCGNNSSGTLVQSCEDGFWTDTAVCSGGDECENDDEQTLTDVCGFNDRGDIAQVCVGGVWEGTDCDDPDECEDEDEQTLTDVCGFNDRGDIDQVCVEGVWDGTNCDDPDECEDDATDTQECLNGSGEQDLLCVGGGWEADGTCTMLSLYRASVSSAGVEGNGASTNPSLSADGRYVAFESTADNLVDGDNNAASDIFVHDMETGETRKVSSGSIVGQDSSNPSISGDGRYVAFHSEATDLVLSDLNTALDVFVHDLDTNTTTRVSVDNSGNEQSNVNSAYPRISADGRYVVFQCGGPLVADDTNFVNDAYLRDRTNGTTTRVSVSTAGAQANSYTDFVDISPDGTRLGFHSAASNLVGATADTNSSADVFVRTSTSNISLRLESKNSAGVQGGSSSRTPDLSTTGRYIAFESTAFNLTSHPITIFSDIYLRDATPETTELVSLNAAGEPGDGASVEPVISGDGRFVAFLSVATNLAAGDADALYDVYVRDRQTATVFRFAGGLASVSWQANRLDLSTDGAFLAYPADDATLVDNDDNGVRDIFIAPIEQGSGG